MSKKEVPISEPIKVNKSRYPHYGFQIFTGVLTLLLFQIIMFNYAQHNPITLGDKIVTLILLLMFGVQSLINMIDEGKNRRGI